MAQGLHTIVVGAGIAGLATAWHLVRRGARATVVESSERAFSGSSGVNAGILRTVVEEPALVELAARGGRALREPDPALSQRPFVDPVGVLLTADRPEAALALERMAAHSLARVERVDPSKALAAAAHVATRPLLCLSSPDEGTIDLDLLRDALVRGVEREGGRLELGTRVVDLVGAAGEVQGVALADGRELRGEAVVLAAGGSAARLASRADSRVRLSAMRRHAARAGAPGGVDPRAPVVWNGGDPFYCRPLGHDLLVCNCDESEVDPEAFAVEPAAVDALRASVARHLAPPFSDAALDPWCGLRTFAPDRRFVLGPDPDAAGLFWAAGLGGHGITCGLAVGEAVARSVLGEDDPALHHTRPDREGAR